MDNRWNDVYITDKSGKQMFSCCASPMSTMSEIRNLKRHIAQAKANPAAYKFLDVDSAVVMLNGTVYSDPIETEIDTDELLKELGL